MKSRRSTCGAPPEAIAALPGCEAIPESARHVHRKLIEQGFFFEQAPGAYIDIEEEERGGGAS